MVSELARTSAASRWGALRSFRDERGQGLVEYALIISVVALGTILALTFLRDDIRGLFSKAGSSIRTAADGAGSGGGPPSGGGGVPAPGTVGITPTGPTALGPTLNATTSGWTNPPITNYVFSWQRTNTGTGCGGAFTQYTTDSGASTTQSDQPSGPSSDNRCYRVVVSATNGSGTSTTDATSNAVLFVQDIDNVNASVSPTSGLVDGTVLTGTADTGTDLATDFTFQWERGVPFWGEGSNTCNAGVVGVGNFGSQANVNDPLGATTKTNSTTTTSGTNQDYCYRVEVSADNVAEMGGAEQDTSSWVFVEGNG